MNLLPVAQPIAATPPAHGLLVTADEATDLPYTPVEPGQDRWGQGFVVQPENCVELSTWDPDCSVWPTPNADGTKGAAAAKSVAGANETAYEVSPFVLETPFECGAHGFSAVDYRGRARRQMVAATSKGMEYEFATGTLKSTNPHLERASTAVVLESGSVFSPGDALALLSQALSNCGHGGRGMIHAPTVWVDRAIEEVSNNIREDGRRLVTVNRGDRIVSGTGYRGYGPGGVAPSAGEVYVYATGPVQYRLTEPMVFPDTLREAMNRANNRIEYRVERECAVYFDPCCHFVVASQVWAPLP